MIRRENKEGISSNYQYVSNAFSVIDIAEPIKVFLEPEASKLEVWQELMSSENNAWFAIIRDSQHIYGYYELDGGELGGDLEVDKTENATDACIPITPDLIVSNSTSLLELIPMFMDKPYYFVLDKNEISHIVTFNDLDKLPFKISIFSLIIELESNMINLILSSKILLEELFLSLSEKRQSEITQLCIDKYKYFTPYGALLSSSFIDKQKMLSKDKTVMGKIGFRSNRQLKDRFNPIQKVRNRVAHSNSILEYLRTPIKLNDFILDIQKLNETIKAALKENGEGFLME